MDCNNGEIYRLAAKELEELEDKRIIDNLSTPLLPLTEELAKELQPMTRELRVSTMRNKPCICGSGKKFKKCCIGQYT